MDNAIRHRHGGANEVNCERLARRGFSPLLVAAVLLAISLSPAAPASAGCNYPLLSLADVTRQAQSAVIADVIRERPDQVAGYDSTLRVVGVIKGRATGPVITIDGLGHLQDDCQGGPRLTRGNRYVVFLDQDGAGASSAWSLIDAEGGVYRLASDGTRFPPQHPLGQPESVALAPADFVRNVGIVAGVDQSRIEALIGQLGLPETIDRPSSSPSEHRSLLDRLPKRQTSLAIAAGAAFIASLLFLLWRPGDPHLPRRS